MLHELSIHHLKKPDLLSPISKDGLLYWQTCLRSLYLSHKDNMPEPQSSEVYEGKAAYELLLKIICGLDSPLVGETEVFGQFRIELNALSKSYNSFYGSYLFKILNQALGDAKSIRESFLMGLGSQSYGSWLRGSIGNNHSDLHIVGGGHLCQEILPWFSKSKNQIFVYTNSWEKRQKDFEKFNRPIFLKPLKDLPLFSSSKSICIVVAPVSSDFFTTRAQFSFSTVFDLRAESLNDPLILLSNQIYIPLQKIFEEVESNKRKLNSIVSQATDAINSKAQRLSNFSQARPFGWDDVLV